MQRLDKTNIQDILNLTPMQEGMLFHYLSNPESKQYIEQLCLTLHGEIDENIIKKAWNHVIQNNEMLRTIFKWDKLDKPLQIILKQYEIPYAQYNLSNINSIDKEMPTMDIRDSELNEKIDISENPLKMAIIKIDRSKFELIITYHHILYDGWSNGILLKEFVQACNCLCSSKPLSLVKKNNFKEFIKHCQKQDKTKQKDFWCGHFEDYDIKSTIGAKAPYSEVCLVNSKMSYTFSKKISENIYEFCKKQKTTVAALLYTAWGILLQKYNNTNDIVFGTTVSGRNADIAGIEDMIGLFINTLPLRVNNTENENIQSLLQKVDLTLKERDEYQSTPLVDIKSYSGIDSKEELFDTLVVIENYPLDQAVISSYNNVRIEEYTMTEMTNYKLTLAITDFKGLELELSYDTSTFDDTSISRMISHFENIIINIIENSVCNISQIDMLTKEEKQQIVIDFNNTEVDYPKDETIHQLFEEQAERTPDNIAVMFEDKALTYKELNERANQLARVLRDKGVGADSIVGIAVERSLEMIVGIMGILKAGGAYLPIDPEYPHNRIQYMLEDSNTSILLTKSELKDRIVFTGDVVFLDSDGIFNGCIDNLESVCSVDKLAYIIYTSGSTGKPKGVVIEHRSICNTLNARIKQYELKFDDNILLIISFAFDGFVTTLFTPLLSGSRVVLIADEDSKDAIEIKESIRKNKITHFICTPALYRAVLECADIKDLETLRAITLAGEKTSENLVKQSKSIIPSVELINEYGPTENSVISTIARNLQENEKVTIGKPISNIKTYILDKNNKLQPIGVAGELCLAGEGLARGYLNKMDLTEEKFVDNPFELGTRMYRTGDLARWLPDGKIEFIGRIDHQVKIRGYRIELGEIEDKLLSYEGVKETFVITRDDNGNKYICAYIVGERELSVSKLREHLSKELPDYMIPSYFIHLEKLPLTPNGKINRRALPEPDVSISSEAEYEAPRNSTEEKLVAIWKEILGVENIGINDNFFELGGHSLKATSLAARIHKILNAEILLKEIFANPTIRGISEYIKSSEESIYSSIELVKEKEYYRMSSAQKRIYTLQQLEINSTSYNMPGIFELEGNLNIERLKEVFSKLIKRHEALRTSFEVIDEGLIQKVHKEIEFKIEEYVVKEETVIQEIVKDFIRVFDLSQAPLLRVGLVKVHTKKYILMYDMHHIISDGTSMGILVEEFSKLYAGEELTPLRIQYKDFSEWQNELFRSDSIKAQEEYWLKQFEGEIPVLNLSTDYQRPAVQNFEGASIEFEIDKELTKKLRQIAKATGSTMYMVLLSALNVHLSKYSGQEDIIIGSPIAGRPHADLDNIIGMFVNTLAMRNYPNGEKTFKEFLREVKENALGAYENQDYQFEELIEKLNVARDFSRNPLFDIMFTLQNMDMREIAVAGIKIKPHNLENRISKFDMIVEAVEIGNSISINIQYCTKLFSRTTIERMYKHLENIIQAVTENIDTRLSEVDMLTKEERKILIDFNNTKVDYPKDKTIHQLFEEQVEKTPDNIAVVYEEKSLTYKELNERANQLARVLRDNGVKSDSIVAIIVDRSLDMIVGIMGVLKSGGAYLPIDPEYPKDRIEYILEDSGAIILLTQRSVNTDISYNGEIIILDKYETCHKDKNNLEAIAKPDNLAYIIYTSGTTGKPKGAMIEHRNVVRLFFNDRALFDFTDKDVWTMFHSYCFDFSVWEMYGALLHGGKLVVIPKLIARDTAEYLKILEKEKVTVLNQTPSAFYRLLEEDEKAGKCELGIRYVIFGGEALMPGMLKRFYEKYQKTKLINMYGITETTVHVTYKEITEEDIRLNISNIGKPIPTLTAYIIDKNAKLLPIGVPGELCVGGAGVCRGYLRRPELTDEKFIANIFAQNPFETGEKLYRSGDLVRMLPDGNMEYMGRIDQQVKIRGHRIELGEIESRLLKYEGIKETIVIARKDEEQNSYLCAYIVLDKEQIQDKGLTVTELRQHLDKELPDYMIPSYFIQLEKLPLTSNGKIDKNALPEPDRSIFTGVEYEEPRNSTEEKLLEIWRVVLGLESVGINDNFFELGGHSLKATSLVSKIRKELDVEVPLREVFRVPTIKGLSEYIKDQEENIYASIEPIGEKEYYHLSSAQKRLYTLQQLDLASTAYNMPGVLEIEGELDIARLEEAFKSLMKRHASLRTSFEMVEGEILQKVHTEVEFKIECWNKPLHEDYRKEAEKIIKGFIRVFDLCKAPLFRVELIKVHHEKYILMYDMHHIISDGTSMGVFVNEFARLYDGEELKELRVQYKDYAAWQNSMIDSEILKQQKDYWIKEFEGEIPVLNLPTDYLRPAIQSFEGNTIYFELDGVQIERLRKIAKDTGTTLYMLLVTNFSILLSKYSGQEDIIIGSPIAGRLHTDIENIIGMFANTLAIRSNPEGKKVYREYLEEVSTKCLKAYENQDYPFEKLVEDINIKRDLSRNPLFDVMLVMQNMDIGRLELKGLSIKSYELENKTSKFDINIAVAENEEKLQFSVEYSTNLFQKETIERLIKHIIVILEKTSTNLEIKLEDIEFISEEEKQQILHSFNDTKSVYPKDKIIHQLFEEQVERTPDNIAVRCEERQLTYGELNNKANQLAMKLRESGVIRNTVVGIMTDKTLEFVIGIMGIMKAGGAFLPIDPAFPEERIKYMLQDSNVRMLITQKTATHVFEGICIYTEGISNYQGEKKNPETINQAEDLLYVIYTSGSTGKPKGVMLEHRNMVNLVHFEHNKSGVNFNTKVLQFATISFDVCYQEIFSTLLAGGELNIIDNDRKKDPEVLIQFIEEKEIEILMLPTAYLKHMSNEGDTLRKLPSCVKHIITAGEQLIINENLRQSIRENKYCLHNHYGPTETHVISTYEITGEGITQEIPPIGKPISNTRLYILGRKQNLQPIGIIGELYIAGDSVGQGYISKPELTAERFIENPYCLGERMYKTGDLAKWLPDGNIAFLGRTDDQVKIRGYRVELREIEGQILRHEAVKEAVVIVKDDNNGSKCLCAYIVWEQEQKGRAVSELRSYLLQELPEYMVPSYFTELEQIPLNAQGKVDRGSLPELEGNINTGIEYEAPRNEIEEKLVTIWQEVLGIQRIGINDNFFELGGHSLKAIKLINLINSQFGSNINLQVFYQSGTIAMLCEQVIKQKKADYTEIKSIPEQDYYELSYIQNRLWLLNQLDIASTAYNMFGHFGIKEKVEVLNVQKTFKYIVRRHESLRTCIMLVEGRPVQRINKLIDMQIGYVDISDTDKNNKTEILESIYKENREHVFNLGEAPLLIIKLVKVAETEYELVFCMHHIISDGWSMEILSKEFATIYEAYKNNVEPELEPLKIQYKDFAAWQNSQIADADVIEKAKAYWKEQLQDTIPELDISMQYNDKKVKDRSGAACSMALDEVTLKKLKNIALKERTSLFSVLLSAFYIYFADLTGRDDIQLGIVGSGRGHLGLEGIMGCFVNTILLRNKINRADDYIYFLKEVSHNLSKALEYQDYPLELVINELKIKYPEIKVFINLLNMFDKQAEKLNSEQIIHIPEIQNVKFDIEFYMIEHINGLDITCTYLKALFDSETIEFLINEYIVLLKNIAENQEKRVNEYFKQPD